MRSASLALFFALSACSDVAPTWVPAPPLAAAGFTLLIATSTGSPPLGRVIDGATPPGAFTLEAAGEDVDLWALEYHCPAELLSLGNVTTLRAVEGGSSRPLPTPAGVHGMAIRGGKSREGWRSLPAMPALLASMRIPGEPISECTELEVDRVELPGSAGEDVVLLLALGPERMLAATDLGHFYVVSDADCTTPCAGCTRRCAELPVLPNLPRAQGVLAEDGTVWLFSAKGTTARGTPERGFEVVIDRGIPDGKASLAVDGVINTSTVQVYGVANVGVVAHFDGSDWRILDPRDDGGQEAGEGVVWLGPGRALISGARRDALLRYDHGVFSEIPTVVDGEPLIVLRMVRSGSQIVVGSKGGTLFELRDERFVRLTDSRSNYSLAVTFIAPYRGGYLYGGSQGFVAEYRPGIPPCEAKPYAGNASVRAARWKDGIAIAGSTINDRADPTQVTLLRPTARSLALRRCAE